MTLKRNGVTIAVETTEVLDTVYEDINAVQVNDMLSYIQVARAIEGDYELIITVPKGHWTYTREFETCLSFTFVMEYWRRTGTSKGT